MARISKEELDDIEAEMAAYDAEEAEAKATIMAAVPEAIAKGEVYFLTKNGPDDFWHFSGFVRSAIQAEQTARRMGSGQYKWGPAADLDSLDEPVSYFSDDDDEDED
jgi:hypothetical protein